MAKSLKEKKIEMKNDWESCLELKLEDKLTEKGLKKFWDENTSLEEAEAMLTHAAVDEFVGHLLDSLGEAIIIGFSKKKEEKKQKKGCQFNVYDTTQKKVVDIGYESYEEADEAAKNYCLKHGVRYADVKVCKMQNV